jgi:hypothetical protein
MKARVKADCGIYGLPCITAGQEVQVERFTQMDGQPSEQYFKLTEGDFAGAVFDKTNLEFVNETAA